MSIKVAEFVTRLEFGGVEAMLLNYTTHFQHPEQFKFHIITQDINDDNCIRQFEDAGYTVHVVTHKRKSIAKNIREILCNRKNLSMERCYDKPFAKFTGASGCRNVEI